MRVGFVDMKRAFDSYYKTKALENDLNAFKEEREQELEKEAKKLATLKTLLEQIDLSSDYGKERERDLLLKSRRFDFNKRWATAEIEEKLNRATVALYLEVVAVVQKHAEATGLDAIFQIDTSPLRASSTDELKLLMRSRGVLYFRKQLDLTDAVIRLLNRDAPVGEPPTSDDPPPKKPAPPEPPPK